MAKFIPKTGIFDDLVSESKPVVTPKKKAAVRERKKFRAQILTYESLIERMDAYAKSRGLSRAEVFEAAVSEYLDKMEIE